MQKCPAFIRRFLNEKKRKTRLKGAPPTNRIEICDDVLLDVFGFLPRYAFDACLLVSRRWSRRVQGISDRIPLRLINRIEYRIVEQKKTLADVRLKKKSQDTMRKIVHERYHDDGPDRMERITNWLIGCRAMIHDFDVATNWRHFRWALMDGRLPYCLVRWLKAVGCYLLSRPMALLCFVVEGVYRVVRFVRKRVHRKLHTYRTVIRLTFITGAPSFKTCTSHVRDFEIPLDLERYVISEEDLQKYFPLQYLANSCVMKTQMNALLLRSLLEHLRGSENAENVRFYSVQTAPRSYYLRQWYYRCYELRTDLKGAEAASIVDALQKLNPPSRHEAATVHLNELVETPIYDEFGVRFPGLQRRNF